MVYWSGPSVSRYVVPTSRHVTLGSGRLSTVITSKGRSSFTTVILHSHLIRVVSMRPFVPKIWSFVQRNLFVFCGRPLSPSDTHCCRLFNKYRFKPPSFSFHFWKSGVTFCYPLSLPLSSFCGIIKLLSLKGRSVPPTRIYITFLVTCSVQSTPV